MKCKNHPEVELVYMNRKFVCPLEEEYRKYKLRETGVYIPEQGDSY